MSARWVNRDAIEWALYEAIDVAAEQLPMLVTMASFTDAQGRGAYPARSLLAKLTRRNISTVIRNLSALVKQGHLLAGDWRLVAHIRSDRRPNVYDLPDRYRAWLARGGTTPPGADSRGSRTPPREGSRGGKQWPHGVASATERGGMVPPKEVHKTSRKRADADAQPSAASSVADENPPPPVEAHPYSYGQFGLCAHCQLPESNRVHPDDGRP